MEMMATADVEMGRDLTPALRPLSHALHDSFLHSHCSACFSPLPLPLHPPPSPGRVPYCSPACSASDSPLHASSAELHLWRHSTSDDGDTSDLRAALRLLSALGRERDSPCCGGSQRIAGLLTNRDELMAPETANSEVRETIRRGAKAMAAARKSRWGYEDMKGTMLEEAALCAVLTNAVEVQDGEGRGLGIAVYGTGFSWINHSCSPNACYRFHFSSKSHPAADQFPSTLKTLISPVNSGVEMKDNTFVRGGLGKGYAEFGPRVILRSIKQIKKGMEVTVAYTDLLQPKALRQSELRSKYQFICQCTRCSVEPPTYVDQVLQDFHAVNSEFPMESVGISFNKDEAIEKLTDWIEDATATYLSDGDAESCCSELEKLLTVRVLDEELGSDTMKIPQSNHCRQLHPLHYVSIQTYTILASAYKVRGSLPTPLLTEKDRLTREASDPARASAGYSLLLAGSVHHLFCLESSLIGSAANFWANVGESLLNLASLVPICPSSEKNKNCVCSLANQPGGYSHLSHASCADFGRISNDFLNCISRFTREIWDFLTHGCPYLLGIRDPIDFSWLRTNSSSNLGIVRNVSQHQLLHRTDEKRIGIFQLGVHCALYGEMLLSICYGESSHRTSRVEGILRSTCLYESEDMGSWGASQA